ncbi:MAG: tetratricopeptide repeat protein [Woeseiaceae bacterium]
MNFKHILKIIFICGLLTLSACATQMQESERSQGQLYDLEKEAAKAYKNKNWKLAEEKYGLLISESPKIAEVWYMLGNIYARTARPEKAIVAYKEAVVRRADYKQAWRNLGIISLRTTAHFYIEMLLYLDHESEVYIRAKKTSEILLKLIRRNQAATMKQKVGKADLK